MNLNHAVNNEKPLTAELKGYFDQDGQLKQLPVWEKLAKEIIWRQIGDLKGKAILDFGSGTGITADHFAADNQVVAIEPSADMLAQQVNTNGYRQIVGSTDELKRLPSHSFDYILCHNVLEYAEDREEMMKEFYRLLKQNGKLSIVKHNRNGRIMQMVVLLNNFDEANNLLDGHNSNAQQFGTINYFDDKDISNWCNGLVLQITYGLRTFWDLQQNQEIQQDEEWQKQMMDMEMRVSQNPDFQRIAFFHHLIFEKRGCDVAVSRYEAIATKVDREKVAIIRGGSDENNIFLSANQ